MPTPDQHDRALEQLYNELVDPRAHAMLEQRDPILFGLVMRFYDGDVIQIDEAGQLVNIPPQAERDAAIAEARAWVAAGKSLADWLTQPAQA